MKTLKNYALNNLRTELSWAMFFLNRGNVASAKSYVQLVQESLEDCISMLPENMTSEEYIAGEMEKDQLLIDAKAHADSHYDFFDEDSRELWETAHNSYIDGFNRLKNIKPQ